MENFVEDYLTTVTSDPQTAWTMLTPDFQAQSGNYGQYQKFWSQYQTADITSSERRPGHQADQLPRRVPEAGRREGPLTT